MTNPLKADALKLFINDEQDNARYETIKWESDRRKYQETIDSLHKELTRLRTRTKKSAVDNQLQKYDKLKVRYKHVTTQLEALKAKLSRNSSNLQRVMCEFEFIVSRIAKCLPIEEQDRLFLHVDNPIHDFKGMLKSNRYK